MADDRSFPIFHATHKLFTTRDGEMQARNVVRVYRSSPETVTLQIRGEKRFMSVDLPFALARDIAAHLVSEGGAQP